MVIRTHSWAFFAQHGLVSVLIAREKAPIIHVMQLGVTTVSNIQRYTCTYCHVAVLHVVVVANTKTTAGNSSHRRMNFCTILAHAYHCVYVRVDTCSHYLCPQGVLNGNWNGKFLSNFKEVSVTCIIQECINPICPCLGIIAMTAVMHVRSRNEIVMRTD